ncbi:uncharacterized protein JCM15063_006161 [Sporobolomyces koalae]|uniref:uncharacterized protein n=1 Tax=Sporobolomyces koalae TaxID=500713 RepID=UPI00316EDE64
MSATQAVDPTPLRARPLPPRRAPTETPTPSLSQIPTATTVAVAATTSPVSYLRSISADAIPHHLLFTGLALLLASGYIAKRLHSNKNRYRANPTPVKGAKKRKEIVVKSILLAQSHDKADDASASSRPNPRDTAKSSNALLPSTACLTSTSAAIWDNLEKIGAVLSSTSRGLGLSSRPGNPASQRTESPARDGARNETVAKDAFSSAKVEASGKKVKGNKGKKAAVIPPLKPNGTESASQKRGAKGDEIEQDDADETTPTSVQASVRTRSAANPSRPLPPSSSDPPVATASASVQTSPRLLPYRSRTPSPPALSPDRRADCPERIASPIPIRAAAIHLPFDLHASFQAKPSPVHDEDLLSTSPSMSPTPSRSPSLSASVSSGSSTGRRPSTTRSASAVPAPQATASRTKKNSKKLVPMGPNGKSVVGLPKPVATEAPEADEDETSETEPAPHSRTASSGSRSIGRDRPAPLTSLPSSGYTPSPAVASDSTPQPHRRLSTASSAYSTSNLSLPSSGSPYSIDRAQLPLVPPTMTMTPPDFAKRQPNSAPFDRDETLRWSTGAGSAGRGREASLRGLGVDIDRGGSEEDSFDGSEGRHRVPRGTSPQPFPHGYFQANSSRTPSTPNYFGSPESSPHPTNRSIPLVGGLMSSVTQSTASNIQQQQPWSPPSTLTAHQVAPLAQNPSRPPSRQSSLSVPVTSTQQQQQQQQLQLHQQQQAYAIAQVQAQAAAQYQQVIALQYQAQAQAQQQQQQHRQQRQRIRTGEAGLDEVGSMASGLAYPLNSLGLPAGQPQQSNWHSVSSHPPSPMNANYPPHISQAVSPTNANFGPSVAAAQAHAQAQVQAQSQAQLYQNYMNQSAAYYVAASASPHPSPGHTQQSLARPRITSSVSAIAVLGGSGNAGSSGSKNGSLPSPGSGPPRASSRANVGSGGSHSPFGGAGTTDMSGDAAIWKARAREAEMDADRNAKELEIARWRLSVLEEEQRSNDNETQEALRALATRAMRAEARLALLEGARKAESSSLQSKTRSDVSPVQSPSSASPVNPGPVDLPPEERSRSAGNEVLEIGNRAQVHPLTWLDLDSLSFASRPSNPLRPALNTSQSSSSHSGRRRAGRNSHGSGNGRRHSGNTNGRRKASNTQLLSPSLHISVPSEDDIGSFSVNRREQEEDDEEDDLVIVLNAPRRSVHTVSRRSSFAPSNAGGDDSVGIVNGSATEDASSCIDEDDIPTVDLDPDRISTSQLDMLSLERSSTQTRVPNGASFEAEEHEGEHVEYVGFLPGFLRKARANGHAALLEPHDPIDNENDSFHIVEDQTTPDAQERSRKLSPSEDNDSGSTVGLPFASEYPSHSTPPDSPFLPAIQCSPMRMPSPLHPSRIPLPASPTLSSSSYE